VLLSEEETGGIPWYLDGFALVQDTPYTAARPSDFSCGPNRGRPASPLLLINHWITTFPPSPTRNERAGGAVLDARVERCEQQRGRVASIVAVDFYERTGVIELARRLNRR
jgi:hypothetical protein